MGLRQFAERSVRIQGQPFSLQDRPYLDAIYGSRAQRIVIRAGRQVEKSTLLANTILFEACRSPGAQILFVSPRQDQARLFAKVRLHAAVRDSAVLRRRLWPHTQQMPTFDIEFANGSRVFVRSAYLSADAIRGISASMLLIDEFQDLAHGELPVIEETMSHFPRGRLVITGTPKVIDNHLELRFGASTASRWLVLCERCQRSNQLDDTVLGPQALVCPGCETPLDARHGRWVPQNPTSTWGEGFWVNQLQAPWLDASQLYQKQHSYDPVRFRNEVLGLPTDLGDHVITRAEIEACCEPRSMASSVNDIPNAYRSRLVAGIDWGHGGAAATVLVIGYIEPNRVFRIVYLRRWPAHVHDVGMEDITHTCLQFRVQWVAADGGGNGRVNNRLLFGKLREANQTPHYYSIFYGAGSPPTQEGILWRWSVDRSSTIGTLFTRIKKRLLLFPSLAESNSFLDEFSCVVALYDEENRRIRYTKAESHRDDAMHATNYAELVGLRIRDQVR